MSYRPLKQVWADPPTAMRFRVKRNLSQYRINPLVTISFFLDSLKVRKKIHLGVQKVNIKFYLDILIQHKDIEVLIIYNFLTVHSYLMF